MYMYMYMSMSCICICICIYMYWRLGGLSLGPPTGKSFRFVRASERARRGEAAWASERCFDPGAGAVRGTFGALPAFRRNRAGCPRLSDCPVVSENSIKHMIVHPC